MIPRSLFDKEPAMVTGIVTALFSAIVACVVAFMPSLTIGQQAALGALGVALAQVVGAIITRQNVTPMKTVELVDPATAREIEARAEQGR